MGVMECGRIGCDNIMCSTYVEGIGYVCGECQEDFKKFAAERRYPLQEGAILDGLLIFMYHEKHITPPYEIEKIDEFFKQRTK